MLILSSTLSWSGPQGLARWVMRGESGSPIGQKIAGTVVARSAVTGDIDGRRIPGSFSWWPGSDNQLNLNALVCPLQGIVFGREPGSINLAPLFRWHKKPGHCAGFAVFLFSNSQSLSLGIWLSTPSVVMKFLTWPTPSTPSTLSSMPRRSSGVSTAPRSVTTLPST